MRSMHYPKRTPEKLDIEVRRPHFDLSSDLKEDWFDGSAFKTAFENAFSLLFPIGEKRHSSSLLEILRIKFLTLNY